MESGNEVLYKLAVDLFLFRWPTECQEDAKFRGGCSTGSRWMYWSYSSRKRFLSTARILNNAYPNDGNIGNLLTCLELPSVPCPAMEGEL